MDDSRSGVPRWAQQMDVCRPASDDLCEPELGALREALAKDPQLGDVRRRVQRLDTAIAEALADVPVPADLAARIMTRLETAGLPEAAVLNTSVRHTRRWWIGGLAAGVAVAAALVLGFFFWPAPDRPLGPEAIREFACAAIERDALLPSVAIRDELPPEKYGIGSYVLASASTRWHALRPKFLGRDGVVYRWEGPLKVRATLYVVDFDGGLTAPEIEVMATDPTQNVLTTGGVTSASWTDGQRLFVLLVEGDEQAFRHLVRAPHSMA